MKPVPKDYIPTTTDEFTAVPDGTYVALSLSISSVDTKTNRPMLVSQKDGRMIARANFKCDEHEPPISFTLPEAKALLMAFGGNLSQLPPVPSLSDIQGVATYLETFETLCANGNKTPQVTVKGGWVNLPYVQGSYPPNGIYTWLVTELRAQGQGAALVPIQGQYGPLCYITTELVGNAAGQPDPLSGLTYSTLMAYKVEVGTNGQPDWTRSRKDGEYTSSGKILSDFVFLIAPSFFSGPQAQNPNSILPELLAGILADRVQFLGYAGMNDKGRWNLDIGTASAAGTVAIVQAQLLPEVVTPVNNSQPQQTNHQETIRTLFNLIGKGRSIDPVFSNPLTLEVSDKGVELLIQYLSPLKVSGIIPETIGHLAELTPAHVTIVLKNIDRSDINQETLVFIEKELGELNAASAPLF